MAGGGEEMQRWKAMMETFLDPKYGVAGAGIREGVILEKLQELLLALSTLLQKLDRVLPAGDVSPAPPPYLHDGGVLLLASVLVAAFSLAGLLYFFFFFSRAGGGGGGGGVWAGEGAKAAPKGPRGEGMPTMSEHECMFLSIGTILLVIAFLGGFYYYYCYQAGCFGSGGARHVIDPVAAAAAGRKLRALSG